MNKRQVPFNFPYMTGNEMRYIAESHANGRLAGDGPFTKRCHEWIESSTGCTKALLTHSCTAALEMAAFLLNIQPGDEIIMPSYTFVSTANAFVLRSGVPVFVDIREDTLNIDERLIEAAITPRTRAIVVVHYAGVSCEMDTIIAIARRYGLSVVEDAAQGVTATYKGRVLGALGDIGAYSFHETKNVISGEGGALLVADPAMAVRAEIIRESRQVHLAGGRLLIPARRDGCRISMGATGSGAGNHGLAPDDLEPLSRTARCARERRSVAAARRAGRMSA
jgi:dTDP-4-amino-4,6-dideoxygalactose transaminase